MTTDPCVDAFTAALADNEVHAAWGGVEDLSQRLASAYETARQAWPELELAPEVFAMRLGAITGEVGLEPPSLDPLQPAEQYLVAACLTGSTPALQAFEAHTFDRVRDVASRFGGVISAQELEQEVRRKLFAPRDRGEPMARGFSGAAGLRSWVRVVALRLALDARRSQDRRQRRHDALPEALPQRDPELELMRRLYSAQFESILLRRLAELEPRQRNLLRCQVVHHMRLEEIARLHGVHRATAARWLAAARETLLQGVRDALREQLGLSPGEIDSVMRLIRSDVHASLITRGLADSTVPSSPRKKI